MRISDNLNRSMHSNSFIHLPVRLNTQLRQGVGYSSFIGAMYVSIVRLIPALVVWAIVSVVSVVARVQKRHRELLATCSQIWLKFAQGYYKKNSWARRPCRATGL